MTLTESSLPEFHESQSYDLNTSAKHNWDINDTVLPMTHEPDAFNDWPDGHCRHVYSEDSDESRRHISGWAMRNTNNHNVNILKKSCLGVLVCHLHCSTESGNKVHLRPAICDKARRKQLGKSCPNPNCNGRLELMPCRGHCGYPVTHFWRHCNGLVYFQAKGVHDHPKPEVKTTAEARRHLHNSSRGRFYAQNKLRRQRKRSSRCLSPVQDHVVKSPRLTVSEKEFLCSCPPFECTCSGPIATTFDLASTNLGPTWAIPTSGVSENVNQGAQQFSTEAQSSGTHHASCMGQQQQHLNYFSSPSDRALSGFVDHFPSFPDPKSSGEYVTFSSAHVYGNSSDLFVPLDSMSNLPSVMPSHHDIVRSNSSDTKYANDFNRSWFSYAKDYGSSECPTQSGIFSSSHQSRMSIFKQEPMDGSQLCHSTPDCLSDIFSTNPSCDVNDKLPKSEHNADFRNYDSNAISQSLPMFSPIKERILQGEFGHSTPLYSSPDYMGSRQPSPAESVHSFRSSPAMRQMSTTPTDSNHSSPSPCFTELQPISSAGHSLGDLPSCRENGQSSFLDNLSSPTSLTRTVSSCTPSYHTGLFSEPPVMSNKNNPSLSLYPGSFDSSAIFPSLSYNTVTGNSASQRDIQPSEMSTSGHGQYNVFSSSAPAGSTPDCVPLAQTIHNNNIHCINITLA